MAGPLPEDVVGWIRRVLKGECASISQGHHWVVRDGSGSIRISDATMALVVGESVCTMQAAVRAERAACAKIAYDRAHEAKIARDNFKAIGDDEGAARHDHYRTSATQIGHAIVARTGTTA